ncbi:MAG: hypothetical protein V4467_04680 [Patescibacteria group bacterium]
MSTKTAPAYANDGVDLDAGDSFSTFAGRICRVSYENSPYVKVRDWSAGQFRGPRTFKLRGLSNDCELSLDPDGNGTKVGITSTAKTPLDSAADLFEMTAMDGVRYGGKPAVFVNQLDASSLGDEGTPKNEFFRDLLVGLGVVAAEQQVVLLKGETAEMGAFVSSEDPNALAKYLWCGTMLSIYHPQACINGSSLRPGQTVVALPEFGLRANGGSSARKAFAMRYGPDWYENYTAVDDIAAAAVPSTPYGNFLTDVNGWNSLEDGAPAPLIRVSAIAHITGGGIPSKFFSGLLKPLGLSAELSDLPEPPEIMRKLAQWRGVSGKEPYDIWHGGPGALVVLDEADVLEFVAAAKIFGIEAKPAGVITQPGTPSLSITSKFDGEKLVWH